jgi:hypothetical protein
MISARAQFLSAGHYTPLADALVEFARACAVPGNLLMEVGAGTAYYLARIIDSMPGYLGLAVDLSKCAARLAAKVHARVDSIVGDVWDRLPIAEEASGLTLDVFAPRQPRELHRTFIATARCSSSLRSRITLLNFATCSAFSTLILARSHELLVVLNHIFDSAREDRSCGRHT